MMRPLSASLAAAQKQETRRPCFRVKAVSKSCGVLKQHWERLYTGTETAICHAVTAPGDNSLIRVRVTPAADTRKLYRQRTEDPGPGGDFASWTYTGQNDVIAVTAAACGAEVSIIWVKSNREVRRLKSTDDGVTWSSPELLDYTQTTSVNGIAAVYKPNGDLAVFIGEQTLLRVKKCTGGQWQSMTAWDKSTGTLSGVAGVFDNDWCLLVTGVDTAGNYKLWSLVYGDGGEVAAGTWSALKEIAFAPAGGEYSYRHPSLDKTDVCRCFFTEVFTGTEALSRPYRSWITPGTLYKDGLWHEPLPFDMVSGYGTALTHTAEFSWLSAPDGVWRALQSLQTLDISADIIEIRQELGQTGGNLTAELMNDDGRYAHPGQDGLEALSPGCRLEFDPGYITAQGAEYSPEQSYTIDSLEHTRSGGKAGLIIRALDGWQALENWRAGYQFRWNKNADEYSIKDMLAVVLARAGLKLAVITNSTVVTGFYPDFTVNPGNNGKDIVLKLLGFVPDRLFIEGDAAYLINPLTTDDPVYSYGASHAILESRYRTGMMAVNHVQVEGWDPAQSKIIIVDNCDWDGITMAGDRFRHITDRNLNTVAEAGQRGAAVIRQAEMEEEQAAITIPLNCGQQLFDVIVVTDEQAGLDAAVKRVTGITSFYRSARGEYLQHLKLGDV